MKITVTRNSPEAYSGDLLVNCLLQNKNMKKISCSPTTAKKYVLSAFDMGDFSAKEGETLLCYPVLGNKKPSPKRLLFVGLGKDDISVETFRSCGGSIIKAAQKTKANEVFIVVPDVDFPLDQMCQAFTEGVLLGNYSFEKYKSKKKKDVSKTKITKLTFSCPKDTLARKGVQKGRILAEAVIQARDMANEPGSGLTANEFASFSLKLSKKFGLKRKVLGKKELEKNKMGGVLAVNRGSSGPPKMVILEYRTGRKVPTLLLVGKGLTFDSGGISLKPGAGMQDMKYDMCGGAAVISAMQAVGVLQPKNVDVVSIVPATDNMPGPSALKPGDIITHYNGKTVEVINTDAEGRLILADALSYGVKKYKPDAVIDLATLTGAVIVGLGHHCSGLMANDDSLAQKITEAGERCGEPVWQLPLNKNYSKQIESRVADLKNVGDKGAGTITAAAFLQEFVGEAKWAHIDIAGTAWDFTDKSYIPKGPSGVGVRLLLDIICNWKKN